MLIKFSPPRVLFMVGITLLLSLSACGLLGERSQIDEKLDAKDLILLLDDLDRDFEAEDTDDLEDLLEDLLDDFTADFEGKTDIEAFSYGIPYEEENVLGFTIEIKEPGDWAVYDEQITDFEDDFIDEFLKLGEASDDYDSSEFELDFGDSSAAYKIEFEDVTADIFTFRRDRFAYIVAHIYLDSPEEDAEDIAETLDERLLDLYGDDDPSLDENEDLEISITTDLEVLLRGESRWIVVDEVAVEEPAAEEPAAPTEEPAVAEPTQAAEEPPVASISIELAVTFSSDELALFEETARLFEAETGISVTVENVVGNYDDILNTRIAAGDAPDIAMIYNPMTMQEYASNGWLVPLSEEVIYQLDMNYHPDWIEMGSYKGVPYGVFHRIFTRSMVWYPKPAFEDLDYTVPDTWNELVQLEGDILTDGGTPWCVGIESTGATGWVASDWIEDILIRTAGPAVYDQWVAHEIPFTHPDVRRAFEILWEIWGDSQLVYGGTENIYVTPFGDSIYPMVDDPPGCWLHRQGSFITNWLSSEIRADLDSYLGVFPFPEIRSEFGTPLIVTGSQFVALSDRPGVMNFLGFLATGESTTHWIAAGNSLFPHFDQDFDAIPTEVNIWQTIYLLEAPNLRWDASDLMPDPVRSAFWSEMANWLNGQDLDTTLEIIEASWP